MASAFTHGFVAVALGKIWLPRPKPWSFWALVIGSAVLPDADVIGFAFGIDYA
jgi:inner membrane protein